MSFYRRRLPHWQPEGKSLFLTWNLRGSLPHNRFPPPGSLSAGKAFVWMDRCLDEARTGPTWLKRPEIAQITVDALHYGSEKLRYYDLHAYVVMPNHVHVLLSPLTAPTRLLQSVKWFSAREANRALARSGEPFWQPESQRRGPVRQAPANHWPSRNHSRLELRRRRPESRAAYSGVSGSRWRYLARGAGARTHLRGAERPGAGRAEGQSEGGGTSESLCARTSKTAGNPFLPLASAGTQNMPGGLRWVDSTPNSGRGGRELGTVRTKRF